MDFLQSIWTALTTENEILINIFALPIMFIEITLTTLLFTFILNISATKKQLLTYILSLSVLGYFTNLFLDTPYNTFLNVIACPIFVFLELISLRQYYQK